MTRRDTFTVAEFAGFSRTTRDTLLYYDKIGILPALSRGENNYRYYSSAQLAIVNLINTYQALGMTLAEINNLKDERTPELLDEHLEKQIELIDEKIDEWVRSRKLLLTLKNIINSALDIDENSITIQFLPAEPIVMGDLNDYSRGRNEYDALLSFYNACKQKYPDLDLNYPVWGMVSEARLKQGDWTWPDRYYFFNPEGFDRRPAALYAVGYTRGGYGQTSSLYERLLDFIDKNDFEISGPAYEEYPLNEICVSDNESYLIRVMITVQERGSKR